MKEEVSESVDMGQNGETVRTKVIIVGDCGCGKTSLIHRYIHGTYTETYTPTGFDTYTTTYSVSDSFRIQMSIWDTTGDPTYDTVRPLSYKDTDLVIICFSINDPESFENVTSKWYLEVREHCPNQPVILVGCKSDLRDDSHTIHKLKKKDQSPVTHEQGMKTARNIEALAYSELSAKMSLKSVTDVIEVAAMSSAGNKSSVTDTTTIKRKRASVRGKRFSEVGQARILLRKEMAKSCVVM
ncbi:hypothetical protein ACJMK2_023598 [Sinanodonta woodiana]|uniref:Rho GTPase n=1 Tax=Sinanodonta woodiana TaxID=1069815 RepID=A0ABD3T4R1_SINWO